MPKHANIHRAAKKMINDGHLSKGDTHFDELHAIASEKKCTSKISHGAYHHLRDNAHKHGHDIEYLAHHH